MTGSRFHWITPLARRENAVTFGAPWAKGELDRSETIAVFDECGKALPTQTKATAYWPDGSVKWTASSAVLSTQNAYTLQKSAPVLPEAPISAKWEDGKIVVESSLLRCEIGKSGALIDSLARVGKAPLSARLRAYIEKHEDREGFESIQIGHFTGVTKNVTLEEAGPLRVVVKCEGVHVSDAQDKREVFPFWVRLYFYAGWDEVKLVHTFMYDGDYKADFLKGLAVELKLAASGEKFNRHVGFVCENGMFYEGCQGMYIGGGNWQPGGTNSTKQPDSPDEVQAIYDRQQLEGQLVNNLRQEKFEGYAAIVDDNPAWSDFRLKQDYADAYAVSKRANPECAYIQAIQGGRSQGVAFAGSASMAVAAGIRDFWQKAPMAFDISGMLTDQPVMTLWLYSRYAAACDFGPSDTERHENSYGGYSTEPYGITNTNELYIKLFDGMPGKRPVIEFANDIQKDILLAARTTDYERTGAFGNYWHQAFGKPYSDPVKETSLESIQRFYIDEIEQRRWYGFWDFGDVMHTYDPTRHTWRYDVGGFAWQNTEMLNSYVPWLLFLRTGNYDYFRFGRNMSRHCAEVDSYKAGLYDMLGTRHNIRHWGGGGKEVRISMAGHHRFFYYLTGDERMGDVLDHVKDADKATLKRDPMSLYFGAHPELGLTHMRTGPDWSSFVSNWMTRWERFEDQSYRDKLIRSINSIKKAPCRLASGSTFHYNPETGEMHYFGFKEIAGHTHPADNNYQQMMVLHFGAPEIWLELSEMLDDPEFNDMLAEFGMYGAVSPAKRKELTGGLFNEGNDVAWRGSGGRFSAYAAWYYNSPEYLEEALLPVVIGKGRPIYAGDNDGKYVVDMAGNVIRYQAPEQDVPRPLHEAVAFRTNHVSQWSLNYIEISRFWEMFDQKRKAADKS